MEVNVSDPSMRCRKDNFCQNQGISFSPGIIKAAMCYVGFRMDGIEVARTYIRVLQGTWEPMVDPDHRGGCFRSSIEGLETSWSQGKQLDRYNMLIQLRGRIEVNYDTTISNLQRRGACGVDCC